MRKILTLLTCALPLLCQAAPRVAVTDLAYEERVREYIHIIKARSQSQTNYKDQHSASNSGQMSASRHHAQGSQSSQHQGSTSYNASASASYDEVEATYSYIERGELRKFTGDIRGEIIKGGLLDLSQAKLHQSKDNEGLYDVIARIRKGEFPGADYVLFGTLSDIDFREDVNHIDHTDSYSRVLALAVVADFSLINTRTYEVAAAFTAMGEGQDVKLVNGRSPRVTHNRARVIRDVSQSLGIDVADQLQEQLTGLGLIRPASMPMHNNLPQDEPARILR